MPRFPAMLSVGTVLLGGSLAAGAQSVASADWHSLGRLKHHATIVVAAGPLAADTRCRLEQWTETALTCKEGSSHGAVRTFERSDVVAVFREQTSLLRTVFASAAVPVAVLALYSGNLVAVALVGFVEAGVAIALLVRPPAPHRVLVYERAPPETPSAASMD
jgi:hypothetical protein